MPITLEPTRRISAGETEWFRIQFTEHLDASETLSSVTVAEVGTSAFTIANEGVNAGTYTDAHKGNLVAANVSVEFTGVCSTVGTEYRIRLTIPTSATPRNIIRDILVTVV